MNFKTYLFVYIITFIPQCSFSQGPQFKFELSAGIGHLNINSSIQTLFQEENSLTIKPLFTANLYYQLADPKMKIGLSYTSDEIYWKNSSVRWTGNGYGTRLSNSNVKRKNLAAKYLYEIFNNKTFNFYSGLRLGLSFYDYYGDNWNDGYSPSGNYVDPEDVIMLRESVTYQLIFGGKINFNSKIGLYSELGLGNGPTIFNAGLFYKFSEKK